MDTKDRGFKKKPQEQPAAQSDESRQTAGKTAISRVKPSKPMQKILSFIEDPASQTYFDYGAGKGFDANHAKGHFNQVSSFDPNHGPTEKPQDRHDGVGLHYVLNVIDEPQTRKDVLADAMSYANNWFSVAARNDIIPGTPHKDGVLTSKGTFQKRIGNKELQSMVQEAAEKQGVQIDSVHPQFNGHLIFKISRPDLKKSLSLFLKKSQTTKEDVSAIYQKLYDELDKLGEPTPLIKLGTPPELPMAKSMTMSAPQKVVFAQKIQAYYDWFKARHKSL